MGAGLGGFLDGIVLHQILQWHHLLTDEGDFPMDTVQGLKDNTVADGFFHVATLGRSRSRHHGHDQRLAAPEACPAVAEPLRDGARRMGRLPHG